MSVIVRGMEMPESCYYCGLTDTSFINCQAFSPCRLLEDACEEGRPEWCPLIEIPDKHGRIIDYDKLLDGLNNPQSGKTCGELARECIIIEAEGAEE